MNLINTAKINKKCKKDTIIIYTAYTVHGVQPDFFITPISTNQMNQITLHTWRSIYADKI